MVIKLWLVEPQNNDGASNAGHVRVYNWNGSAHGIKQIVDIDGEAGSDNLDILHQCHQMVMLLLQAAYGNDGTASNAAGHVRVYNAFTAKNKLVTLVFG